MSRKVISTLSAAAISMTIVSTVPVVVMSVSSLAITSQAHAFSLKKIKRIAKRKYRKTKNFITAKNCPGGKWIAGHGICGKAVDPKIMQGRIGNPVRGTNPHDHRRRRPGGVVVSFNPWRWR